ncbi:hypothetical protein IG631_00188 [Alternaria alternata]|nr:hypothetical protein IG631_00188 [Alternaria alternata]
MLDSLLRGSRRAAYSHYDSILADATYPYFQAIHRQSPGGEAGQHQKLENIISSAGAEDCRQYSQAH